MSVLDEFKDVKGIPQDDGPNPIVPIAYEEEFVQTMDIFRAVLQSHEISERVLRLTEAVIELNAANYTAWHYRRECLFGLQQDLEAELEFCSQTALASAKNYQLWHHRRCLIEKRGKVDGELEHVSEILAGDAKNYHAWSHRQWVLKKFNVFDDELKYVDSLLVEDLRNNSAWNQRYFVISNTTGYTDEVTEREVAYTMEYILKAVNNESSWNYLYGIIKAAQKTTHNEKLLKFAQGVLNKDEMCHAAGSFIVEACVGLNTPVHSATAIDMCEYLSKKADVIRSKYWDFRKEQISAGQSR